MIRLSPILVAALAPLLALTAWLAVPGPAHAESGYRSETSYVAVGRGGTGPGGTAVAAGAYAASGFDVRALDSNGNGGFIRLEHGTPGFFDFRGTPLGTVLAFDVGYSYGIPLAGDFHSGLLGFLEVGLTGWEAGSDELFRGATPIVQATHYGFGLSLGASLEGSIGPFRVGIAVNRRDVPFFLGSAGSYASTTTLQLRIVGAL